MWRELAPLSPSGFPSRSAAGDVLALLFRNVEVFDRLLALLRLLRMLLLAHGHASLGSQQLSNAEACQVKVVSRPREKSRRASAGVTAGAATASSAEPVEPRRRLRELGRDACRETDAGFELDGRVRRRRGPPRRAFVVVFEPDSATNRAPRTASSSASSSRRSRASIMPQHLVARRARGRPGPRSRGPSSTGALAEHDHPVGDLLDARLPCRGEPPIDGLKVGAGPVGDEPGVPAAA